MAKKTSPQDAATDEHHGHGGSYVVGADGRRVLSERTAAPGPKLSPEPAAPVGGADVPETQPE